MPITAVITTRRCAWPMISSAGGTGVARRRFSTPLSRIVVTEITRFAYAAMTTDIARMPGT